VSVIYPRVRAKPLRTRISNGKELLAGIDGRSRWARRLHELVAIHIEELGGQSRVSQAQFILVKAAANLVIVLEEQEVAFARDQGASLPALMAYQTTLNSLRRTYEVLGLDRKEMDEQDRRPPYDLTKLSSSERKRLQHLSTLYTFKGMDEMNIEDLKTMTNLLRKASGLKPQEFVDDWRKRVVWNSHPDNPERDTP